MGNMGQAAVEQNVAVPGSRKGILRGAVVGVVATIVLLALAWGVKSVLSPGARTFTTTCSGATVTGTIWVDDTSDVVTSVAVVDPKSRSWTIAWGDYAGEVADSTMIPSSADYGGSLLSATQMLGDTDGGTHRTAQVRPVGQQSWCALHMHVHWFW